MYAKQRQNLCHRNKDISMTTYFSSAPKAANWRTKNAWKRKQQISGRGMCVCVSSSFFSEHTPCMHASSSIVSFCESIEHRLVVPVPVVLYQFLVFGSFIICAAQCSYCVCRVSCVCENVCRFIFVSPRPNERAAIEEVRGQHQNESFSLRKCVYSRTPILNRLSSAIISFHFSRFSFRSFFLEII